MDINEPIVLENEFLLCDVDSALAQAFLRDAQKAVERAGAIDSKELQASVIKSMLVFHQHRAACEDCNA
jgi:hypothetical protein